MTSDIVTIFKWKDGLFGMIIQRRIEGVFMPQGPEWILGEAELEPWEVGQILGGN